jgi:hypothetical protein
MPRYTTIIQYDARDDEEAEILTDVLRATTCKNVEPSKVFSSVHKHLFEDVETKLV